MLIFIILILLLGLAVLSGLLFVRFHPVFGSQPDATVKATYHRAANYHDGRFHNSPPIRMERSLPFLLSMLRDSLRRDPRRSPGKPLPFRNLHWDNINGSEDTLTWFGHSTFLLTLDGKKLILDPMFGPRPSPVSFVGSKRYSPNTLDLLDQFPTIDAVLITHDHYDHLDYSSIQKLKDKVRHYIVPLGVGAHLQRWGISLDSITELSWWQEIYWEGLKIASVPSRHFSGRGPRDTDSTLWTGYVLEGTETRLYASGDGGYGSHFSEIGTKYGPFDLTLIEGGQYDSRWADVHMKPEDAVQAHLDVRGKRMMLTHWGAFTLAFHPWAEPVERVLRLAGEHQIDLMVPSLGETVPIQGKTGLPIQPWWNEV